MRASCSKHKNARLGWSRDANILKSCIAPMIGRAANARNHRSISVECPALVQRLRSFGYTVQFSFNSARNRWMGQENRVRRARISIYDQYGKRPHKQGYKVVWMDFMINLWSKFLCSGYFVRTQGKYSDYSTERR